MQAICDECDIAIVGAGLVGASLALALGARGWRIALIENALPATGKPAWDERCIAINAASRDIFTQLGVWDDIGSASAPILATHISERGRFGVARFSAAEAGLDALGYNTPLRVLNAELQRRALAQRQLQTRIPAQVVGFEADAEWATLSLAEADGERSSRLRCRLVVAADGAQSSLRQMAGIGVEVKDYAQVAVVSALRLRRPHAGVAYERFLHEGPLAILPKPDDAGDPCCSLVWTVAAQHAPRALSLGDADYLNEAQQAFGERLGPFKALGRRSAYPLLRRMATQLTAQRLVLLGNAAQTLHPVAAQGFNLGLRDVAVLAAALLDAQVADPGDADLLARYAAARSDDRRRVADFTDLLVSSFSNRVPVWSGLRHLGLLAVDLAPGLRTRMLRQNLGLLGGVPPLPGAPTVTSA